MPGVCCAPFVLTLMFSPIPSHLLYTCSPEHSLPPDKRERRDERRGRGGLGDLVSPETLIGSRQHSFQSSCPASLSARQAFAKCWVEVLRDILAFSTVVVFPSSCFLFKCSMCALKKPEWKCQNLKENLEISHFFGINMANATKCNDNRLSKYCRWW